MYDSKSERGPDSDADELWRDSEESRQSRAVSTVMWMSHGRSHEPDVTNTQQSRTHGWNKQGPRAGYQCIGCKQTLVALGQHAGSPYLNGTR